MELKNDITKINPNFLASAKTTVGPGFFNPTLDLVTLSVGEESVFYPAQHIQVYGEPSIIALRDFLNLLLSRKDQSNERKA